MSLAKRMRRKSSLPKRSKEFNNEGYTQRDLPILRRKRTLAYNRLSKAYQIGTRAETDRTELDLFLSYCQELHKIASSFEEAHASILSLLEDDDLAADFDDTYFKVKAIQRNLTKQDCNDVSNSKSKSSNVLSQIRLPKITLPNFSGDIKLWPEFIDTFNALIHNSTSLNNSERFHYLIASLSGDALSLVRTFPVTGEFYQSAYDALVSRYHDTRELAFTCWRDILNVNLKINNVHEFRRALDSIEENLTILKKIKLPVEHWDFVLIYHFLSKLDSKTRREFEEKHSTYELPTFTLLKPFLDAKCEAMLRDAHFSDTATSINSRSRDIAKKLVPVPNSNRFNSFNISHTLIASAGEGNNNVQQPNQQIQKCSFCTQAHSIISCDQFLNKSIDDRLATAVDKKRCFNCLKSSHQLRECRSLFSCKICKRRHHTLLHKEVTSTPESNGTALITQSTSNSTVLLATALIQIKDASGQFQHFRGIFDSGSQNNLITEKAVKLLNIIPQASSVSVSGLGDVAATLTGVIKCSIGTNNSLLFDIDMQVIKNICGDQPISKLNSSGWSHIKSLPLADPGFDIPGSIDVLFGADVFAECLLSQRIKGNATQPPAFNSVFGWLLLGKAPLASNTLLQSVSNANDLNTIVQRFWEIDVVPKASTLTPSDVLCEQKYQSNHSRDSDGRYIVKLPFKDNEEPVFVQSRDIALRRFHAIERRLSRDPDLRDQYIEFMSDYESSGHMTLAPSNSIGLGKYYIPHHCVVRPESTTTKLRVVFDASAKDATSKSLNETLLAGPKLQTNIGEVLLHFREHKVVFMADIRQMYRQILIDPSHRDYQRILWRPSPDEPIKEFILNTVTYGVASASFLAIRTINQLAIDEGKKFPLAEPVLKSDIYVDDIVTGCDSLDNANNLKQQVIKILELGKFQLRKWASNEPQLLADIPPSDCLLDSVSFDDREPTTLKVLGLKWEPLSDSFLFEVKQSDQTCTKRSILSELARIFDPLGFLSPLTIQAKCLIQKLWIIGVGWDESPPQEIIQAWHDYQAQMHDLKQIRLPRRLTCDNAKSYELHGFCDSSERAYGAIIYMRVTNQDGLVQTFMVCSKARVAPLKKVSLPRLELCAAVLLAELLDFVKATYLSRLPIDSVTLWSDSTVVLSWLRSHSSRWVTFVANRVSRIHDLTPTASWRHVPSAENPADVCSRGQLPSEFVHNVLWWTGPAWLTQSSQHWPLNILNEDDEQIVKTEERTTIALVAHDTDDANHTEPHLINDILTRYSSLDKAVRIIGYIMRFINNSRVSETQRKTTSLTNIERYTALMKIVKHVQSIHFHEIIAKILAKQLLPKPFRKLNPLIDNDGILRVGGRLSRSGLEYEQKYPALLPSVSVLTTKVIESIHRNFCHPGLNTTQYLIVQQFWILSAKRAVRHCLSKCVRCYRTRPQVLQPFMSDLPSYRVNQIKPFSVVGCDYGGPFRIKASHHRGAKTDKAYLCLFICLATKAVHLEVVSTLSTEEFLAALRRFVARRGRCNVIHADCGTNFVGADNYLTLLMKQACERNQIVFQFNPPSAPHFGGVWEINIRAAKTHLHRVVADQLLTFEELTTLFSQIEAVLNSRPLCPLSSDPNDISVLTPGHFLTTEPLTAVPDDDLTEVKVSRLNRWQLIQSFLQSFWSRWKTEYLHSLTVRAKWTKDSKPLTLNSIVLIKDDNRSPLYSVEWLMCTRGLTELSVLPPSERLGAI